ncbi:replicative DNA helicase [Kitasatospora sp. NPDC101801]|uniref:replicative DNA helicase n=1 Tax=Kitasatospora sp. NPDC101801 TaxID=3364103 RepID=UPI0037FE4842
MSDDTEPVTPAEPDPQPADYDLDERGLLSAMMRSPNVVADVLETIESADFRLPAHGLIYLAVLELYGQNETPDPIVVGKHLADLGDLDKVGGQAYIDAIAATDPSARRAVQRAQRIHQSAVRRRLGEAAVNIDRAAASGAPIEDVIALAEAEVFSAADPNRHRLHVPLLSTFIEEALDFMELAGTPTAPMSGIPTGFAALDALTNGLQNGNLIVIGSRPAIGKSTLAMDILRNCAITHGIPAALFTLQMRRREVSLRLLSAEARVALHHMRSGNMTDEDWIRVARRMPDIAAAPLYVDESPKTLLEIRSKARRLKARNDIGLIVIDPVQLLHYGLRQFSSRYEEVNEISRHAKAMAMELDIPVVVLSQLNRGPEQRADKRPQPYDLRDSGTLEDDADLVILLHREDAYEKESPRAGLADLIIAKHSQGPNATIEVAFQGHYSRFVDMAPDIA